MPPETEPAKPATSAPAAPPESISEKMERLGWKPEEKHDANPNALGAKARAAEAEPAPAATAGTEAGAEVVAEEAAEATQEIVQSKAPNAEKLEQLKALSAELGMLLEDGRVTTKERAEIRVARRELREQAAKLEADAMGRVTAATKLLEDREAELGPKLSKVEQFEKAIGAADHEEIAKLAGFESWDKFQEHIIALKADPAYKRLRAVETQLEQERREKADRDERDKTERDKREMDERRAQGERQQAHARQEYIGGLSKKMTESADPLVKAMADDPSFTGAVFRVIEENWRESGVELTPEQALRKPAKGAAQPLMAELKKLYDRLHPVFAASAAAPAAKASAPPARKPTRSPAPTTPPAPSVKKLEDKQWKQDAQRRLEEAAREEAIERRGRRAV